MFCEQEDGIRPHGSVGTLEGLVRTKMTPDLSWPLLEGLKRILNNPPHVGLEPTIFGLEVQRLVH